MGLAVIDHVVVDLVRHHRDVGKFLRGRRRACRLALGRDTAGRIGRRVHDEEPRLRRDQRERLLGREGEIVLFADRHRDRPRAGILNHRAVDRKAGIGIENVGARLPNIRIDMNMVGLPPGRIITSSGDTST